MEYNCEKCKYKTIIKQCFNKHLLSERHKVKQNSNEICFEQSCPKCSKIILSRTSLWRHTKNCTVIPEPPLANVVILNTNTDNNTNEILKKLLDGQSLLVNENKILRQMIIELSNNPSNIITNSNSNNTNNFNLQFFLNEQCKDAINIKDFVKELCVEVQTLQNIENKGYVKGVSEFILDNLNKYSLYTRPIHYVTDNAEKTVQIRDENTWKKDSNWESNTDKYSDIELEEESILENTISDIDEKIYDEFKIYQTQTLQEQPKLNNELSKEGIKLSNRNKIMHTVLDTVAVNS